MFLKCRERRKDGKIHRSWSIVESRRYAGNKVAHRHVLYLGDGAKRRCQPAGFARRARRGPRQINDSQRAAWERSIAVIDEREGQTRQLALFPDDRTPPPSEVDALQVRLSELRLSRPRQWGACWLADHLWRTLHLDDFFGARLPLTREGTDWEKVLRILVSCRLISPGSCRRPRPTPSQKSVPPDSSGRAPLRCRSLGSRTPTPRPATGVRAASPQSGSGSGPSGRVSCTPPRQPGAAAPRASAPQGPAA
jgi:hypothetical protein